MKTTFVKFTLVISLLLAFAMTAQGLIPNDDDGDGVPNGTDLCPAENSSGFDRNGDGCLDAFRGARHTEYWSTTSNNISYVINATAAPNITNGTDITAVRNAVAAWPAIANTGLVVTYGGTVAQTNGNGLDHINLVTFLDNAYSFSSFVLAVGLTTSFDSDTTIAARVYRKGEIFDADMLFNPSQTFKVGGAGPGVDIQSVATHEAGHLFGISHSAIQSSTMFYALPGGLAARSLTSDDQLVYFKAYGSTTALASAKNIRGTVRNGNTNLPVPGAIVFLVNAATNDTTGCDYTLPDGTYTFPGIANGNYYVAIHALDGTSPIGFIQPGNINALVAETAFTNFGPEWYNAAESASDDPAARTQVTISNGAPVATVNLITNVDVTAPVVLSARPNGTSAIAVDGAIVIEFSEAIDIHTIQSSFSLRDLGTNLAKGGNIALISDDKQIVFTPSPPLAFSKSYRLRFDTDLKDHAGNSLASDYTVDFTTEVEPPVSISSLAPNKGVIGTTLVITGQGFDVSPLPVVKFGTIPATVSSGTVGRLVVDVPAGAVTGSVTVTNADLTISNPITFTVLTDAEFARGYESGQTVLPAAPNAIAVTPSGNYAYIAGIGGAHAVVINPALFGYLSQTNIPYPSELEDIATTANSRRAYAISSTSKELVEINTDPTTGLIFNTVLASRALGAVPRGIITDPTGQRAYIAMDDAHIQSWDIELGSVNYNRQVGLIAAPPASGFVGPLAITPAGDRLLALTDAGTLAFYALPPETLLTSISVGTAARGVVVDPQGDRAYVTHDNGDVTVVNLQGTPFRVQDIATGGSARAGIVTPAGSYFYSTDRELDNLKIVDLKQNSSTFRSVVGVIPALNNPVDVAMSPGGEYAFSVLQGGGSAGNTSPRMLVTTIGIGPSLEAVAPSHGHVGVEVVLSGRALGDSNLGEVTTVDFNGTIATVMAQHPDRVVVQVPTGATTGPVRVRVTKSGVTQQSNALFFEVFQVNSFPGLRESVSITADGGDSFSPALAMRPQGDVAFVGTNEGRILAFDTRPGSPTFHQSNGRFLASNTLIKDLAVSKDGRALFVAPNVSDPRVLVMTADPNAPLFGEEVQDINLSSFASLLEMSPDNKHLLVFKRDEQVILVYDVTGAADGVTPQLVGTLPLANYADMEFHPSGFVCYLAEVSPVRQIVVLDTDVDSPTFGTIRQLVGTPGSPQEAPVALAAAPDGSAMYVATMQLSGPPTHRLVRLNLDQSNGLDISSTVLQTFPPTGSATSGERLVISPRGDTGAQSHYGDPLHLINLTNGSDIATAGGLATLTQVEMDFDPTGNRLYFTDIVHSALKVFELANPAVIFEISGDNQNGVTGQFLSSPVRCQIFDNLEFGFPVPGISVHVQVTSGGGLLKSGEDLVNEMIVATDQNGYVNATWQMGTAGLPQQVQFSANGLVASPVTFTATSAPDPGSLPLSINEILPQNAANGVSATTAIVATFSRAVDPATVAGASFFVQALPEATLVPVTFGFTDSDRRVSLTPSQPLAFSKNYRVTYTSGIHAPGGSLLANPSNVSFTTGAAPPLALSAIFPPSALTGATVTISGTSFNSNPAANVVHFTGANATPVSGNTSELVVRVPAGATPGPVTVTSNAVTSNALNFTVLVPNTSPIDEVVATINTGSGAKTCTVSPDGTFCYTVSPDGDVVIPVDITGSTSYPAITVGDQPVAIVMRPDGKVAYVANFNSGTVSLIDTDRLSATFNTVIGTITVGLNPSDLAVFPDGDRVLVANAGSGDLSIIDSDGSSVSYHQVVATVGAGTGAKSCTVSPDGTRMYVGTSTGFVVIQSSSYQVVSTVNTGTGAKSLTVTPDGTLLFILTTAGTILVVDVHDGSASQYQVVATVGAGTGAKGLTVSPDGTLLYVILEDSDTVLVIAINVIPGVGVANANGAAPPFTFQSHVVDQITLGADPAFVAVDPSGSGKIFVPTPGTKSLVVINSTGSIHALVNITPHTLNLQNNFGWVLGEITLPLPYLTANIVKSTVRLQGTVPVVLNYGLLLDLDHDGVKTLYVAFNRAQFQATLPQGEYVTVTITGQTTDGKKFSGTDVVRTLRPTVTHPHDGDHVLPNRPLTITWTTPQGYEQYVDRADVHFSGDDGATWTELAHKIPNTGAFNWVTPNGYFPLCRVIVTLYWKPGANATYGTDDEDEEVDEDGDAIFGMGISEDPVAIEEPLAVRLKSAGATVVDGDALIRWETNFEEGVSGFNVVRSDAEEGTYTNVTRDLIAARGGPAGASYEYRDPSIRPNLTYWYKLVEVTPDGDAMQFGPYSVSFKVTNSLAQNVPNPFNPLTTIKYSIAEDIDVSLVVYDVSGRRVRTLVSDHQRADVYKVVWDGVNDQGGRVASGMYFYKLVAGKYVQTRKMMLLK